MSVRILTGDCREVMAGMDADSVDAIVTDPPYALTSKDKRDPRRASPSLKQRESIGGFMGMTWDGELPGVDVWWEAYRVLKPGGHMLAFGGTRTHHRLMVAIEDAGFEIRDCLMYLYGAGFPKAWNFNTQYTGEWCDCNGGNAVSYDHESEPHSQHNLRSMRDADLSAGVNAGDKPRQVLFESMPEQGTSSDGQAWAESQAVGREQSSVEGGTLHRAGEGVCDDQDARSSTSAGEWLRPGTHPGSGEDDRSTAGGRRGSSPSESRSNGQPTGEPPGIQQSYRALDDRALRDGGLCTRCGKLSQAFKGFSSALKPSYEPIILARKPLIGSVAANVERYGTGGINVDGCRIEGEPWQAHDATGLAKTKFFTQGETPVIHKEPHTLGRWPANVILDEDAAAMLDAQSGERRSSGHLNRSKSITNGGGVQFVGGGGKGFAIPNVNTYGDTGGASRFFYTAKASRAERNKGLDGMPERETQQYRSIRSERGNGYEESSKHGNHHPTVKPLDLMQWLVRLVTPPGGTVLDPFGGSGSTMVAADREGFHGIYIDLDPEYAEIARRRCVGDAPMFAEVTTL